MAVCLGWGLLAAVVAAPVALEQAMERTRFTDRLGTVPVEVSLAHNGVSTIDTGVLGRIYWDRTGAAGFGAYIRVTDPPEAGGTLSSYVDPKFLQVNAQLVNAPADVADAYGRQITAELLGGFLRAELVMVALGAVIAGLVRWRSGPTRPPGDAPRRAGLAGLALLLGLVASSGVALGLFSRWQGNAEMGGSFPLPGLPEVSFSSPQTREVAAQVQPFIEKNTERIQEQARRYRDAAESSLRSELRAQGAGIVPRDGEQVVLAEADPQGSWVGTRLRQRMYALLLRELGEDAIALRTVSGDITSNGTLAEENYVEAEMGASEPVPTVAVAGDHDSDVTAEQLERHGATVPDLSTETVGDLEVAGANDPEFKTLFGGTVGNDTDVSETELGELLRAELDGAQAVIVLLHQPRAALTYLGLESYEELAVTEGHLTQPWDDGIPDLPPGTLNIGHLHDADGPWVVWNTDTEEITWTVVDQLGTSGGVEERPTFNRFSTPYSTPLKTVSVRLQYVEVSSGLQTGYATVEFSTSGKALITDRVDVGLPGGAPTGEEEAGAPVTGPRKDRSSAGR